MMRSVRLLCALGLLWLSQACLAHPVPESQVWLDSRDSGLEMTVALPLSRLELAFGHDLTADVAGVEQHYGRPLLEHVLQRIHLRSNGRDWTAQVLSAHVLGQNAAADWVMQLQWTPPAGASARSFDLTMNTIVDEVKTHQIQVLLRTDWNGGVVNAEPRLLGSIRNPDQPLHVDLGQTQWAASAMQLVQTGLWHVWEGADHLLFLLLLLLVCTQQTEGTQWARAPRHWKSAWRQALGVITAFTIGHSTTLVLSLLQYVQVSAPLVETCVAWTIVVTAVHALRPLWQRAHVWMAVAFGCVHGMAFSSGLSSVGLTGMQLAAAILSFNLGIELAQILLLLMVFPAWVLLASHPGLARYLRMLLAGASIAYGLLWVLDRTGYSLFHQWPWLDLQAQHLYALPPVLWLLALGPGLWHGRERL